MTDLPFIPAGEPDEALLTRLFGPYDDDMRAGAIACLRSFTPAVLDINRKPVMLADKPEPDPPANRPGNIADVIAALAGNYSPPAERTTPATQPVGTNPDGGGTSVPPTEEAAPVSPASGAPTAAVSQFSPSGSTRRPAVTIPALAGLFLSWLLRRLVPIDWRLQ